DEHGIPRPPTTASELGHGVELADRDELHAATPPRVLEPWRHVPGGVAELRVRWPRPGIVPEVEAAHEGEIDEPRRLPADLGDQRARLAAARRQQHAHAGAQPLDRFARRRLRERARHGVRYIHLPTAAGGR